MLCPQDYLSHFTNCWDPARTNRDLSLIQMVYLVFYQTRNVLLMAIVQSVAINVEHPDFAFLSIPETSIMSSYLYQVQLKCPIKPMIAQDYTQRIN